MADNIKGPPFFKFILIGLIFCVLIDKLSAQQFRGRSRLPSRWSSRAVLPRRPRIRTVRVRSPLRAEMSNQQAFRSFRRDTASVGPRRRPSRPVGFQTPRLSEVRVPGVQRSPIPRREPIIGTSRVMQRQMTGIQPLSELRSRFPSNRIPMRMRSAFARRGRPGFVYNPSMAGQRQSALVLNGDIRNDFRTNNDNNLNNNNGHSGFDMLPQLSIPQGPLQPRFRVEQTSARRSASQSIPIDGRDTLLRRRLGTQSRTASAREPTFLSRGSLSMHSRQQPQTVVPRRLQTSFVSTQQLPRSAAGSRQRAVATRSQQPMVLARKPTSSILSRRQSQPVVARQQPRVVLSQPQTIPIADTGSQQTRSLNTLPQSIVIDAPSPNLQTSVTQVQQTAGQGHIPLGSVTQVQQMAGQGHIPSAGTAALGPVVIQGAAQGVPTIGNLATQPVVVSNDGTAIVGPAVLQQGVAQVVSVPAVTNMAVQPVVQTVSGGTGSSDLIFEELVNAFTNVLQNPAGQPQVVSQTVPVVQQIQNQHPQSLLQNNIQLQTQPIIHQHGVMQPGVLQPGVVQPGIMQPGVMQPGIMQPGVLQAGIMQPGVMQPGVLQHGGMIQPGVVGGHMHGNPFGFMNPWMMGGMNSAMMQEMMFGDTTDPPDPVATTTTTTVAPPTAAVPVSSPNNTAPVKNAADAPASSSTSFGASSADTGVASKPVVLVTADANIAVLKPEVAPVLVSADVNTVGVQSEVAHVLVPVDVSKAVVQPEVTYVDANKAGIQPEVAPVVKTVNTFAITTVEESPVTADIKKADVTNTVEVIPVVVNSPASDSQQKHKITDTIVDIRKQNAQSVNPKSVGTVDKSTMSFEEKIIAEVAAMLPNNNVDMAVLSQVLGQVATELKAAPVESIPSAIQLGLKSLIPDPNAKKLSKKEIVEQLKGSTRGVVVYPPTPPTVVKQNIVVGSNLAVVESKEIADVHPMPAGPPKEISPVTSILNEVPKLSKTTNLSPHVEIPTLPPHTGHVDVQPEVYRTLQTILDHNPAAVVEVLSDTATPAPQVPKISVKSLVDIDPKSNLPNLQSILTDISTGPREAILAKTANASILVSQPDKPVLNIEPIPNALGSESRPNITSTHVLIDSKIPVLELQPLVDASTPTAKYQTHDSASSNFQTTSTVAPDTPFTTVSPAATSGAPTEFNTGFTEPVTPFSDPTSSQAWTVNTFAPFVETSTVSIHDVTTSIPANFEGVPVNISHDVSAGSPVMANMEGVPVSIEKIASTESGYAGNHDSPVNMDATGALAILQEIRSFKPDSSSAKQNELAKKLSDPKFVDSLRSVLKTLIAKASSTTPLSTTAAFTDWTTPTLPFSSTEEYEADEFITETPTPEY